MQLEPYLFFHGKCEEALKFYVTCFNGEIVHLSRVAGSPMEEHFPTDQRGLRRAPRTGPRR